MAKYNIQRGNATIAQVKAKGRQHRAIMVEDRVQMEFRLPTAVKFKKGDRVVVYGTPYKINRANQIKRSKDVDGYSYSIEFEALYYDLSKWYLNTVDQNNQLTQKTVYLMSDALVVLQLIVDNANQADGGWSLGDVDETEVMQHTFPSFKLLTVLQDLADKYDNEFWFSGPEGKTINFSRRQEDSGIELAYGAGNGLYEISRDKSDARYYNKLTIQGGNKNIPSGYGFERLQLPLASRPALTTGTDGFDVVEEDIVLENVFPSRIGVVSSVGGSLEVFDTSLNFDINDHLTPTSAKIEFISGQLAGFTFSISSYDHAARKISFNVIDDDPAYPIGVPNAYLKAAIGDKYVLLDIDMPQAYVDAAEAKLLAVGQALLEAASQENYSYGVSLTPKWMLINNPSIILGNTIRIQDGPMDIDVDLRILGYDRDLQEAYRYGLEVGSAAKINPLVREATAQATINNAVTSSGLSSSTKFGSDTLDTVAKRGKATSEIIEPRGVLISDLMGIPPLEPSLSEMVEGRTYLYGSAIPAAPPLVHVVARMGDLLNFSEAGRQDGYIVYWDETTSMYRLKENTGTVTPGDLTNYFTKDQSEARYKPILWEPSWANVIGKPTHLSQFTNDLGNYGNFAFANGSNASGTWGINISGNAAKWGGNEFLGAATGVEGLMVYQNGGFRFTFDNSIVRGWLGLPSTGAYDLQWVTTNGYTTTTQLQASRIIAGYDSGVAGSVNGLFGFFSTSIQAPSIKATAKLLIPTIEPTDVAEGECAIFRAAIA